MAGPRSERELIKASNAFAHEVRWLSWFHLISTLGWLVSMQLAAAWLEAWWLRLGCSLLIGLLTVRMFILFHDFKHGSILQNTIFARVVLDVFGWYGLTPASVWSQTHNYHHAHTAKIASSHVGSYAMLTTELWQEAGAAERAVYKLLRHPMNILLGYLTVFFYGFCVAGFLRNPRKNVDSLIAILLQVAIIVWLWHSYGFATLCYVVLFPQFLSHALGAYLFYAQHNYPDVKVYSREEWTFTRASLESSSYMRLGPVMNYFTGNIGYHHVHHLNYRIPFYRLPEAMAAIPELREPRGVTSLHPRDILACFRQKLWSPAQNRMVPYR